MSSRAAHVFGLGSSIAAESELEKIRSERAAKRLGRGPVKDVGENVGTDFNAPELEPGQDMGFLLEPFNMRRENEEGNWDESGHYVKNLDEEKETTDAWLDTVDAGDAQATFRDVEVQRRLERRKQLDAEGGEFAAQVEGMDEAALRTELTALLEAGENATQAIKRLKGHKVEEKQQLLPWERRKAQAKAKAAVVAPKPKAKKGKRKWTEFGYEDEQAPKVDDAETKPLNGENGAPLPTEPAAKRRRTDDPLGRLTILCDALMRKGFFDVYSTFREDLSSMQAEQTDEKTATNALAFTVGDRVRCRDVEDGDNWKLGRVTSLNPLKVKVDGRGLDIEWDEVEPYVDPVEEALAKADKVDDGEQAADEADDPDGGPSILDMLDGAGEGPQLGDELMTAPETVWEYKWTEDGEVYQASGEQMTMWRENGMFQFGVYMRCGDGEWQHVSGQVPG